MAGATTIGTEAPYLGDGPEGGTARWLIADDGVRIRAVIWPLPSGMQTRGTVLIFPGRTEHAEKYGHVADAFARLGLASVSIDWRGQGLAQRLLPDTRKGHVGRFSDYQRDVGAVLGLVGAEGLPDPLFLFAHSMGGAIGLRTLLLGAPIKAAGFTAPMWGIKVPFGAQGVFANIGRVARAGGIGARYAPPPASGPICYVETAPFLGNTLTRDRAMWDQMQADIRNHPEIIVAGPTFGWLAEALGECKALAHAPSPPVRVWCGLGSDEQIVDVPAVEKRMQRWPQGVLQRFEGGRHELLMDLPETRAEVIDALARLYLGPDASAPGSA